MSIFSETPFEKKFYRRQPADDWKEVTNGLWHSVELKLFWKDGSHYDLLSASHNGLVGAGANLREIING